MLPLFSYLGRFSGGPARNEVMHRVSLHVSPLLPAKEQKRRRLREAALWRKTQDSRGWRWDPVQVCGSSMFPPIVGGPYACPPYLPSQMNMVVLDKNCDCLWICTCACPVAGGKKLPLCSCGRREGGGKTESLNPYTQITRIRELN